jgi:uncharacterized protein YgiM (DUF1202 family)
MKKFGTMGWTILRKNDNNYIEEKIMKRNLFILLLIVFVTGFAAAQSAGTVLYVAVKSLTLKSGTGAFDSNKATLPYGEKVIVVKVEGKYAEVKSEADPLKTGWTLTANLSKKQIVAGSTSTASAKEMALAGKGFSQETEKNLKSQKKDLNFADVDKTEAIKVHEKEVKKFIEEGKLKVGENK